MTIANNPCYPYRRFDLTLKGGEPYNIIKWSNQIQALRYRPCYKNQLSTIMVILNMVWNPNPKGKLRIWHVCIKYQASNVPRPCHNLHWPNHVYPSINIRREPIISCQTILWSIIQVRNLINGYNNKIKRVKIEW